MLGTLSDPCSWTDGWIEGGMDGCRDNEEINSLMTLQLLRHGWMDGRMD